MGHVIDSGIIDLIDNRQDILSDILGFCGGSYIMSGRVSRKWNSVYKMKNKTMTTSAKQYITIDSIWDFIRDEDIPKKRDTMSILFATSMTLVPSSIEETRKIVMIKKNFIGMFRWGDNELIQFSKECVRAFEQDGCDREFINDTLEEIIVKANRFKKKCVMFEIMEGYYTIFPEKMGCDTFTLAITQNRYWDILVEYVEKYEYGNFNQKLILKSTNEDLIIKLREFMVYNIR